MEERYKILQREFELGVDSTGLAFYDRGRSVTVGERGRQRVNHVKGIIFGAIGAVGTYWAASNILLPYLNIEFVNQNRDPITAGLALAFACYTYVVTS